MIKDEKGSRVACRFATDGDEFNVVVLAAVEFVAPVAPQGAWWHDFVWCCRPPYVLV